MDRDVLERHTFVVDWVNGVERPDRWILTSRNYVLRIQCRLAENAHFGHSEDPANQKIWIGSRPSIFSILFAGGADSPARHNIRTRTVKDIPAELNEPQASHMTPGQILANGLRDKVMRATQWNPRFLHWHGELYRGPL